MIIPAEYHTLGSLPPHWIIDPLMKYLSQDYYVGLLSAASLYGATTQQPMTFQVITNKTTKNIPLERGGIEFHTFKHCEQSDIKTINAPTGYVKISTKEQTLIDLVRFHRVSGYLSNVATVIKELAQECDPVHFAKILKNEKTKVVLQRLGYILEITEYPMLAQMVEDRLSKEKIEYIALQPDIINKEAKKTLVGN